MIDREYLEQYSDLRKEIVEVRRRIADVEAQLYEIEHTPVKDKVYGGEGGIQGFVIEGISHKGYSRKKTELLNKIMKLRRLEEKIEPMIEDVDDFILNINDSMIRRIVTFRFVDGLSWQDVAQKIGGGNTEGSVKMAFRRFFDKQ